MKGRKRINELLQAIALFITAFMRGVKYSKTRRFFATFLAGVIVFVTTYSLILPAITIERNVAEDTPGIYLEKYGVSRKASQNASAETEDTAVNISGEAVNGTGDISAEIDHAAGDIQTAEKPGTGLIEDAELASIYMQNGAAASPSVIDDGSQSTGAETGSYDGVPAVDAALNLSDLETVDAPEVLMSSEGQEASAGSELLESIATVEEPALEKSNEPVYFLTGAAQDAEIRLDFQQGVNADTILSFSEITEHFDDYFNSAKNEIEVVHPETAPGYTVSGARFFTAFVTAILDGSMTDAAVDSGAADSEAGSSTAVKVTLRFAPGLYDTDGQGIQKLLVVEWSENQWHIFDEAEVAAEINEDGSLSGVTFDTNALRYGYADFGVVMLRQDEAADDTEEIPEDQQTDGKDSETGQEADSEGDKTDSVAIEETADTQADDEGKSENGGEDAAEDKSENADKDGDTAEDKSEDTDKDGDTAEDKSAEETEQALPGVAGDYEIPVSGADFSLHITYGEDAMIPEAPEFTAALIDDDQYEAQALDVLKDAIANGTAGFLHNDENETDPADPEEISDRLDLIGMFDLTVYSNGKVIQPQAPIKVEVVFNEEVPENRNVYAVHFPGTGEQPAAEEEEPSVDEVPAAGGSEEVFSSEKIDAENEGASADADIVADAETGVSAEDASETESTISSETAPDTIPESPTADEVDLTPEVIPTEVSKNTALFYTSGLSYYAIVSYTVDFHWMVDGENYTFSIKGGSAVTLSELVRTLGIVDESLLSQFIQQVQSVAFSKPELIWAGKAEEETTVGSMKAENALKVNYSEDLTSEEIERIDAMVVPAGDWALISLEAFDTEESLIVTMKDGEQFTIRVTDARKPKLANTYIKFKIVKEWYDSEGNLLDPATLDETYYADFNLQAYEYDASDLVRLHFVDSQGNEDTSKTVIVPTGMLQVTLYNTPGTAGEGYLFSEAPTSARPISNPYDSINLLSDIDIQAKSVTLDDGSNINYWVMDIDLNDYAGELTDVYLGIMPHGETTGISYFTTDTYPDQTVNVSATTKAMNIAFLDSGRWHGDTYRNRHIWNTIKGSAYYHQHVNSDLELTSPGGSSASAGSFFGYTLVEREASAGGANNFTTTISWNNGANTIYSNGLTGWSPNLFITSPNQDTTIVVKNQLRADVDVPVEKHWSYMDQHDDQYDWEATFVLQWAPLYEGEGTPSTPFVEVEPRQYVTITEGMMDDFGNSFNARSFKNLPLYGEDENGPFRYEYSVEEESYTIKSHISGEVLATYDRHAEGEKYTGTLPHFVPYYPHDAGELSANPNDYMVMVVNGQAHSDEKPTINITVNKLWEDEGVMEDDTHDYHATVKIQRYDQQSTRKVQDYDPNTMIEIKFYDQDNNYVKSEYVEKGVQQRVHVTWNSYGYQSSSFSFTSTPDVVRFNESGHSCGQNMVYDSYSDWFYPTQDIEIHITKNVWNENDQYIRSIAVNPKAGLELLDEKESFAAVADDVYNADPTNVFTLSLLENRWSTIITDLPLTEITTEGDTQTIHHYSYYFVEDEENTTPSGYKSSYVRYDTVGTDNEIELGDDKYRINYDGEHVTIKNIKDTLRIRKEWRGVAKSDWVLYPDSVFDLYGANSGTPINQASDGTLIRSGLHLNKTNNWEWVPEDENWGADGFPHYDYYYVVERTDQMSANSVLETPAWDNNKYIIHMYYNETGRGNDAHPWEAKTNGSGTITILNALHSSEYLQIDLKKKWMEWGTPTSWDTTTGVYKRLHDLVMGFVVYRRVWDVPVQTNSQYPSEHIISPGPKGWSDYGNEILAGYDSNGQRVLDDGGNTFEIAPGDGGNWHWTIKNQDDHNNTSSDQVGLTSEGWYTKEDGSVVWAYYEYTLRETGIWKNLKKDPVDDPEISWFTNSVPIASRYKGSSQHNVDEFNRDIGQDQDRLMNGQGFDMWVEKDWVDSAWDAREVYVKIYRKLQQGGNLEDFTEELARDISNGSLIGYLSDGYDSMIDTVNGWIVFTPGRSRLYIDKVLKTFPTADGTNPYDYWLVEVGYKDKHGQIHMYSGNGTDQVNVTDNDLLKLKPTYYAWDSVNGNWTNQANLTGQNNQNVGIVLGEKGTNQLKVTNTPVRDFAVIKKWQNALGEDISNDPRVPASLQIKIKQIRTATVQGENVTKEAYVQIGGNDTLTLTGGNSDNRITLVAQTNPGNTNDSQNYTGTVTTDTNVGGWALYISGLEEKYYDENAVLWNCTYKVEEQSSGIPIDFVTEVSYEGIIDRDNRNITITNIKMDGGMLKVIKQIADDSDYETEDPFMISVTLTPPLKPGQAGSNGEREEVFNLGPPDHPEHQIADYIEIDPEETILIGTPDIHVDENKVVTIIMTLAGRGSFTIRDIKPGTIYEVAEDLSGAPGWRQEGEVVYSNSNKVIVKKQLDTATITNRQVIDTTVNIPGTKEMKDGSTPTSGSYSFSITAKSPADAPMPTQTTVTNDAGSFEFRSITYESTLFESIAADADGKKTRDFVYTVKEVVPAPAVSSEETAAGYAVRNGVKYDLSAIDVTVTVTFDTVNHSMSASVAPAAAGIKFTNEELVNLKLLKTVQNNTGTDVSDQSFTFNVTLTAPAGSTNFNGNYQVVKTGSIAETGTQAVAGGTAFTVTMKGGDTWQINDLPKGTGYTISEGTLPLGWLLIGTSPQSGTISTAGETKQIEFINNYNEIKSHPQAKKKLTGRNWKQNETFTFSMAPEGTTTTQAITDGKVEMPGTLTVSASNANVVSFQDITFREAGEYTFKITETAGQDQTLTYSAKQVLAKAVVTKSTTDGSMSVNWTYTDLTNDKGESVTESYGSTVKEFENIYNTSVEVNIPGTKELTGRTPDNGQFAFNIEAVTPSTAPTPAQTRVSNTGTGFSFGPITYSLDDLDNKGNQSETKTFTYKITEDQTGVNATTHVKDNILYDQAEISVAVTLTYDFDSGVLSYTVDKTAAQVKFTNTPQKTTVDANKSWLDVVGGTTPPDGAEVTFAVFRDGASTPLATFTLTGTLTAAADIPADGDTPGGYESSAWNVTFKNLPKYKDDGSAESVYLVKETAVTGVYGYTNLNPDGVAAGGTIVNEQEEISVPVSKAWLKNDNSPAAWPTGIEKITVQLKADNQVVEGKTYDLTEAHSSYTFTDLPKYDSATGDLIDYSIAEIAVEGYASAVTGDAETGFVITNTPKKTNVTVVKNWTDSGTAVHEDDWVKVMLYRNEADAGEQEETLNSGNSWTKTWSNLPVVDDVTGLPFKYAVVETDYHAENGLTYASDSSPDTPKPLTKEGDNYTVTIDNTPGETINVEAIKKWGNDTSKWPENVLVVFQLQQNGVDYRDPVTIDKNTTDHKAVWSNLPKADNSGTDYIYTVVETVKIGDKTLTAGTDYSAGTWTWSTATVETLETLTGTIKNDLMTTDIPVSKIWHTADDEAYADAVRFELRAEGVKVEKDAYGNSITNPVVLNSGNNWEDATTFVNLPKLDANGDAITYSVVETGVLYGEDKEENWKTPEDFFIVGEPEAYQETGYSITNTPKTTEVEVDKKWFNGSTDITSQIQNASVSVKLTDGTNDVKVDAEGNAFISNDSKITITDGIVTMTGTWSYKWLKLPKFDKDGNEINYTVVETEALVNITDSLTPAEATGSMTEGYLINNTLPTTDVEVIKEWEDPTNIPEGTSVEVTISAKVGAVEYDIPAGFKQIITLNGKLDQDDDTETAWQYKWKDLPKYNDEGSLIGYTVAETGIVVAGEPVDAADLPNYQMTPDNTNTAYKFYLKNRIPLTEIKAKKNWKQNTLPAGVSVKFKIKAVVDGSDEDIFTHLTGVIGAQEQTLTGGTDATVAAAWEAVWSKLPEYYQGKEITYTVTETEYKIGNRTMNLPEADASAADGYDFSFTNDLPTIDIPVIKAWENAEPAEGDYVKIGLFASDGTTAVNEPGTQTPYVVTISYDEANGAWPTGAVNFENLPVYDANGNSITYVVKEIEVKLGDSRINDPVLLKTVYGNEDGRVVSESAETDVVDPLTITNTVGNKTYKVYKTWGDNQQPPEGAVIQITLTGTIPNETPGSDPVEANLAELGVTPLIVTLDGGSGNNDDMSEKPWEYEWANLPKYNNEGKEITYTSTETGYWIGQTNYTPKLDELLLSAEPSSDYDMVFTNKIPTTEITVKKIWTTAPPAGSSIEATLKGMSGDPSSEISYSDLEISPTTVVLNGGQTGGNDTAAKPLEYTWEDLPEYDKAGKKITYTVSETKVTIANSEGNVVWDSSAQDAGNNPYLISTDGESVPGTFTFTNDYTSYAVEKKWEGVTTENDYIIQVQLKRTVESEDPNRQTAPENFGAPVTIKKKTVSGKDVWDYLWSVLPKTDPETHKDYVYSVEEIGVYASEMEMGSDDNQNLINDFFITVDTETDPAKTIITNKLFEIHVLKVDKNDSTKTLGGAKFILRKDRQQFGDEKITPDADNINTGEVKGRLDYTDLPVGKYELEEMEAPPGYAKMVGVIKFEIKADGTIVPDLTGIDDFVEYDGTNFVFTVKNEEGARLPSTGGMGTTLHYMLGSCLAFFAGSLLFLKRKRKHILVSADSDGTFTG